MNGLSLLEVLVAIASPTKPLPQALHELAMKESRQYSLVGGMPEVVKAYCEE
jgi:hypothetical protein